MGCLIPFFYIKPQPPSILPRKYTVVLYLFSTSNHNMQQANLDKSRVVLYLFSTSNHNTMRQIKLINRLSYTFFLHQTTTWCRCASVSDLLSVSVEFAHVSLSYTFFLHQTTTQAYRHTIFFGCLIPFFYIKPQLRGRARGVCQCCLIPFFYIKPQRIFSILLIYRCLHYFASI